jgi:DNA-binding MarR family transcriptional regulator
MKDKTSLALTQDLFQLMKRFPRPKLKQSAIDGLTRSEYELLVILVMHCSDAKAAWSVSDIGSLLQITPAGVTHLINPLEEAGYVERLPDPHDRRIVLIGLTDKGTEVAEALISEVQENLIGLVNHMGEENSRTLIRLMSQAMDYFTSQFAVENGAKA